MRWVYYKLVQKVDLPEKVLPMTLGKKIDPFQNVSLEKPGFLDVGVEEIKRARLFGQFIK